MHGGRHDAGADQGAAAAAVYPAAGGGAFQHVAQGACKESVEGRIDQGQHQKGDAQNAQLEDICTPGVDELRQKRHEKGDTLGIEGRDHIGASEQGAVYLIYLGIKTWRSRTANGAWDETGSGRANGALFRSAYVVTALNPKSIAFFVAFLPQFVDPGGAYLTQLIILGVTFLVLAMVNAALYAFFAGALRDTLKRPAARRWVNRFGGSALIGAGVMTAAIHRTA